jgi:hypothetical protein
MLALPLETDVIVSSDYVVGASHPLVHQGRCYVFAGCMPDGCNTKLALHLLLTAQYTGY